MPLSHETELPADVIEAVHAGQTILAIKLLREHRALGLKEAKEMVDAYIEGRPKLAARRRANREAAFRTMKWIGLLALVLYAAYRLLS